LLRSLPMLDAAAPGHGLLSVEKDADGLVRRVPLMALAGERPAPALSAEMLRIATGANHIDLILDQGGAKGLGFGELGVATQRDGSVWLNLSRHDDGRFVSAADVLLGHIPPSTFDQRFVLLGVTGLGLVDLPDTALGPMPGVELHAQLLENVFDGEMASRPRWAAAAEMGLTAVIGLLLIAALPALRLRWYPLGAILPLAALTAIGYGAWLHDRWLIDVANPALAEAALFVALLGGSLAEVDAQRRRLRASLIQQRIEAARLTGELEAAQRIQMSILPLPRNLAPDARYELHAMMIPARQVGGDLYDFFKIDDDHLFFAIGDVSGKGVPAALFMAMSKEVLRAAAVQHGESLDRVFAAANEKISSASGDMLAEGADMMFVTVFAGVLDLVTGMLVYACAGHDAPLLLRGGTPVGEIASVGGPPLGTVDDFPYPVDRRQLDRGDLVLVFTDGVSEADDDAGNLYGVARLRGMAATLLDAAPRVLVDEVREDVKRFASGTDQADDITLMAIRWLGPPGGQ
jgi:serine phosphatase RsbU (regulator of sigma subunit)